MGRIARVALSAWLVGVLPAAAPAAPLEPHIVNGDSYFRLDWEAARERGHLVVRGTLHNDSPYAFRRVALLVEALDSAGAVQASRVSVVPGEFLPSARHQFVVPAPPPSATYRVRVYSFERIEAGGPHDR